MTYCGRDFSITEINLIRKLIADNPRENRTWLARNVCELLGWLRPSGLIKDMSCKVAMIRMHKDGLIQLPPPKFPYRPNNRRVQKTRLTDPPVSEFQIPSESINDLQLTLVANKPQSRLWNEFIDRYHYLGYTPLPGAQLRYFAKSQDMILALFGFGAAAWMTAPRDKFIGWNHTQRQNNLHLIVNNARFLILPWVHSTHLASMLLGLVSRQIADDWEKCYAYRPVLLETFVETPRFKGTAYKSANWIHVGQTQGRGKLGRYKDIKLPVKDIYLYPLHNQFRKFLCT